MPEQSNVLIEFVKWLVKWVAILVAGLIALGVLLGGGWWAWNWWSYERHKGQIHAAAINSAAPSSDPRLPKVTAERCVGTHYPILVVFMNNSPKTIEYIDIEVNARLPGRSSNILTWDAQAKSDQIVEPNTGWGQCYSFRVSDEYKSDPGVAKAIYSAKVNFVRFRGD
jgi:hypothetical protein